MNAQNPVEAVAPDQGEAAEAVNINESVDSAKAVSVPVVLDSLDEFEWHGQKWTPEKLNAATLMQADYTRKTQALANEQKLINNVTADLGHVKNNPALAPKFKELYPERFHYLLDLVLNQRALSEQKGYEVESGADVSDPFKARVLAMEKKLEEQNRQLEEKFHNEKVESVNTYLDSLFTKLQTKYDLADEDAVVNRAQRLLDENRENPLFKMTDGAWERLFRQDHELRDKKYSERLKSKLNLQTQVGAKAQDIGPGGQVPGKAVKRLTFDEATEQAIKELSRR